MKKYKLLIPETNSDYHSVLFKNWNDDFVSLENLFGCFCDFSFNDCVKFELANLLPDHIYKFVLFPCYNLFDFKISLRKEIINKINNDENTFLLLWSPYEAIVDLSLLLHIIDDGKILRNKVICCTGNLEYHNKDFEGVRFICVKRFFEANYRRDLALFQQVSLIHPNDKIKTIHTAKKKFLSLNRNFKFQRVLLQYMFNKTDCFDEGHISYHLPETYIGNSFKEFITQSLNEYKIQDNDIDFLLDTRKLDTINQEYIINYQDSIIPYYNDSLFSIVSESDYRHNFITEKTFKAITHCHPFIILGNKRINQRLRDYGYRTFENLFDIEGLENSEDIEKFLYDIKRINIEDWKNKILEVWEDVEHNWNTFFNSTISFNEIIEDVLNVIEPKKFTENFCMAPWTHISVYPDGNAYPCCMYDWESPVGNANLLGLKGVWNSESMKTLRLKMLENEINPGCKKCIEADKHGFDSYRSVINKKFKHHYQKIQETQKDGTLENLNLAYFDVRFSNLCNMKCRTCGIHFSSRWYEDVNEDRKPVVVKLTDENLWRDIDESLINVEEIYFTGGEVLVQPEHYQLLDKLIKKNIQPKLIYNSNGSKLEYQGKHIVEFWKYFPSIEFNISIDHIHNKAEYIRHGQKWSVIQKNLEWLRDNMKEKVKIKPSPTISIFNVLDLKEIVLFLFDNKLATDYFISLDNFLFTPEYYNIQLLPTNIKKQVLENISSLPLEIEKYKDIPNFQKTYIKEFIPKLESFMNDKKDTHNLIEFKNKIDEIDLLRKEKFIDVFPNLRDLYEQIN